MKIEDGKMEDGKTNGSLADREYERHVLLNGPSAESNDADSWFMSFNNYVITSRYTWYNFLPKNLLEQFSHLANLYFLGIGVLQMIPDSTTTNGIPSNWGPLTFIIGVSMLRAGAEDRNKHKADDVRNSYPYKRLTSAGFQTVKSGDIMAGDIIRIEKDDMIPADVLFLGSSLKKGHCFIDKANLNGETSLEVMFSIPETRKFCRVEADISKIRAEVAYEAPNGTFDSLHGTIKLETLDGEKVEVQLDGKSLLMRETALRNCEYIYGLVMYVGAHTKIEMSNAQSGKARIKVSRIFCLVEKLLKRNFIVQFLMCLAGGVMAGIYNSEEGSSWYLDQGNQQQNEDSVVIAIWAFLSWFILLSQMVPISLTVTAEMVKFAQSMFIQWDMGLYWEPINRKAKCNSSTIHEELGMIEYVFSDKTGTLTQNRMEFRYALLPDAEFGSKETEIAKSVRKRQEEVKKLGLGSIGEVDEMEEDEKTDKTSWSQLVTPFVSLPTPGAKQNSCACCNEGGCCFAVARPRRDLDDEPGADDADTEQRQGQDGCCACFVRNCWNNVSRPRKEKLVGAQMAHVNQFTAEERKQVLVALWGPPSLGETAEQDQAKKLQLRTYLTHMALSNTVVPFEDKGEIKFQVESSEELAMVEFARSVGFFKKKVNPVLLEITTYDQDLNKTGTVVEEYLHLATFGFTSKRARVTVIYQARKSELFQGKIVVMAKGQDTVMLPLMTPVANEPQLLLDLKNCSSDGLRTLLCTQALQPAQWWQEKAARYNELVESSEDSPEHTKMVHDTFEAWEKESCLEYTGSMGLEDQLQALVPEAIADFLKAGIRVWMITGDKAETAKNIGIACNLIDPDMQPVFHSKSSLAEAVEEYQNCRLIEVTGQWASMVNDDEQLHKLFQTFDFKQDGVITSDELAVFLESLKFSLDQDKMNELTEYGQAAIDLPAFLKFIKSVQLSVFDAVKADIEEGLTRYRSIEDHQLHPISVLVNRTAFKTMFPSPEESAQPGAVSPEQLEILRSKFFLLASVAKSVVFARAEPAMKKRMVTEVMQRSPSVTTLAIGDGANDTDMITAAHVGVGIAGVEGTAATNSADYAIGTFHMLHTLLFVHGVWNYERVGILVNFIFFKAIMLAVCAYMFAFFSAFSGSQYFSDFPLLCYNVMFTAMPVIALSVLDKRLNRITLQNNPVVLRETRGTAFSAPIFFTWIVRSVVYGSICFFIPLYTMTGDEPHGSEGASLFWISTASLISLVLVPTFLIMFEMQSITFLHWMAILSSISSVIFIHVVYNLLSTTHLYYVFFDICKSYQAGLSIFLTVSLPLIIELAYRAGKLAWQPSLTQIMQEKMFTKRRARRKHRESISRMSSSQVEGSTGALDGLEMDVRPSNIIRIKLDESEEQKLAHANKKKRRKSNFDTKLNLLKKQSDRFNHDSDRHSFKTAVIKAMLRFRNLTGTQFDSAARAELQVHDSMAVS